MEKEIGYSRFELKYRIHYQDYLKIRNAIQIYMKKDRFTTRAKGKGYLVRSLYFDTDDYAAYHEKMDGNNERVKLRIRSYSEQPGKDSPIRVELKIRKRNLVIKKSAFVTYDEYCDFMQSGHWRNTENPTLVEFERQLHSNLHKPKVLIEYRREGYETRLKNGLRITFDHKVKSAHSNDLFPKHSFFREHNPHLIIMEIKFKEDLPHWVKTIVHQYGLKIIANSKFTQGIQAARHDLYHPGGAVIIR